MKPLLASLCDPLVAALAAAAIVLSIVPAGASSARGEGATEAKTLPADLLANAFDRSSAHHRPIGTGAVYGILKDGVRTRGRLAVITEVALAPATGIKYLNRVKPEDPRVRVLPSDAHGPVRESTLPFELRIPTDAAIPPYQPGHDNCVLFFPRNGSADSDLADQFFGFFREPTGAYRATVHKAYSLKGSDVGGGTSASRIKFPSGVLRGFPLNWNESNAPAAAARDAGNSTLTLLP